MGKARQRHLRFPEVDQIITVLREGIRQDLVILIIPSHDRENKPISDQEFWAEAAMDLFADLYRGATALETFKGVYKSSDGTILYDKPIMIESYVDRSDLEDPTKLAELLRFIKRMGKKTKQAAVGLVINSVFHEITDFKGV